MCPISEDASAEFVIARNGPIVQLMDPRAKVTPYPRKVTALPVGDIERLHSLALGKFFPKGIESAAAINSAPISKVNIGKYRWIEDAKGMIAAAKSENTARIPRPISAENFRASRKTAFLFFVGSAPRIMKVR
jgi:hypothetical protein